MQTRKVQIIELDEKDEIIVRFNSGETSFKYDKTTVNDVEGWTIIIKPDDAATVEVSGVDDVGDYHVEKTGVEYVTVRP